MLLLSFYKSLLNYYYCVLIFIVYFCTIFIINNNKLTLWHWPCELLATSRVYNIHKRIWFYQSAHL